MGFEREVIGDAILYRGDCRDVLCDVRGADVVVTDPPYGMNTADWDMEVPLWALPLIRDSLVEGGGCYWFGMAPNIWHVGLSGVLDFQREIIWWHATGFPSRSNWRLATETVLYLTKGSAAYFDIDAVREEYEVRPERPGGRPDRQNARGKSPGNVMRFPRPAPRHVDETAHPHAKPVGLLSRFILASCPPGGIVLDPFMGSGSVGVSALRNGRRYIGIERDAGFFDMACRRLSAEVSQGRLAV